MTTPKKLGILVSSGRVRSVGQQVAAWVRDHATDWETDVIEVRDLELPPYDEPGSPKQGKDYEHDHTQAWSRQVEGLDALVVISPEYNGSYPGALKNAIDYLYEEWADLPVAVVAYGYGGGTGAIESLERLLGAVQARVTGAMSLTFNADLTPEGVMTASPERVEELRTLLSPLAASRAAA